MASLFMKKDKGFTLVEMMVVIGIVAIVSAVAIPNYLSYAAGSRLRSATQEFFSNVKKSQMNAVRYRNIKNHVLPQNTLWCMQFSQIGYQVINCGRDNGRCAAPSSSDDISDTIDLQQSYPGVSFKQEYSGERIVFYPDGTIDDDDNQQTPFNRIYSLKDSKGDELELKFTGAGAVRIKRPQDP